MSRRSSNNLEFLIKAFGMLTYWFFLALAYILIIVVRIVIFLVSIVIFYSSKYKKKTGNGYFKTIFDKGCYGEYLLYRKVKKVLDPDAIILNAYLPSENENLEDAEIDLIAVSHKYVYCFEMKNYKGRIFGFYEENYWTQFFNSVRQYSFYNPIKQNEGHMNAIENYLFVDRNYIVPIVVFANKTDISKVIGSGVIKIKDVKEYILDYETRGKERFGDAQVEKYINKLNEAANVSPETVNKHIEEVREIKRY